MIEHCEQKRFNTVVYGKIANISFPMVQVRYLHFIRNIGFRIFAQGSITQDQGKYNRQCIVTFEQPICLNLKPSEK